MRDKLTERILQEAYYTIKYKATVRQTAKVFGVCKSTVHYDITSRLYKIDPELYYEVRPIIMLNKLERTIRGGKATKEKWLKKEIMEK